MISTHQPIYTLKKWLLTCSYQIKRTGRFKIQQQTLLSKMTLVHWESKPQWWCENEILPQAPFYCTKPQVFATADNWKPIHQYWYICDRLLSVDSTDQLIYIRTLLKSYHLDVKPVSASILDSYFCWHRTAWNNFLMSNIDITILSTNQYLLKQTCYPFPVEYDFIHPNRQSIWSDFHPFPQLLIIPMPSSLFKNMLCTSIGRNCVQTNSN